MKRFAVAVCLLVLACQGAPERPPAPAPVDEESRLENGNLLNLVFGAAVVDRDNELHFEASAAQAIDGNPMSLWSAAPDGPLTGVFSLPALTRLERLGAAVPATKSKTPATLRFEASLDGAAWANVLDLPLHYENYTPQLRDVRPPVVARYLRVTLDTASSDKAILSLHATGRETALFVQPPIEGCWEINNQPARFVRSGARIAGVIGNMPVEGGSDGRVYRLTWLELPMWGYAALSVSSDGQHLSAVRWHEEVNPKHSGDGWLGKRVPCTVKGSIADAQIVDAIISRTGRWRLYGVRFDREDRVIEEPSLNALDVAVRLIREHSGHRFRLVAREFRSPSEAQNRARCDVKLASMRQVLQARGVDVSRLEFVNAGNERPPLSIDFTSLRVMDSSVELHVVAR